MQALRQNTNWIGISAFGIQSKNFQGGVCKNFIEAVFHSPAPAIAVLYQTFGKDNRCLKSFWQQAESRSLAYLTQFHFSNEAGRRAGTMDKFDFYYKLDVDEYNQLLEKMPLSLELDIRERVTEILSLTEGASQNAEYILSTGLEDNYSKEAFDNLYGIIREEWPHRIARNAAFTKEMRKQEWEPPEDIMIELHGYTRKLQTSLPCIANGDGQDVDFLTGSGLNFRDLKAAKEKEVISWLKKAREKNCITFLWAGKWQGFFDNRPAPRPLLRKFRFDKSDIAVVKEIFHLPENARKLRKTRRLKSRPR